MRIMTFNTQHCKNFLTGEIDFARMAGIECVIIDEKTNISDFELRLLLGDAAWK